jgi:two-component system response regulator DesR
MANGQVGSSHPDNHRKAGAMNSASITPYASSLINRKPARTGSRCSPSDIDVLIADDRRAARDNVWGLLNCKEGIRVIAAVQDAEEAIRVARDRTPRVCLVAATLLARDGLDLAYQIKRLSDPPRVLIYADRVDERLAGVSIIAEADGVVDRCRTPDETAAAIRRVASGEQNFLTPVRDGFDQLAASVDDRDRAIVAMLLDNAHPDDIAATLGLSARSLRQRHHTILTRLKPSSDLHQPPELTSAQRPRARRQGHRRPTTATTSRPRWRDPQAPSCDTSTESPVRPARERTAEARPGG